MFCTEARGCMVLTTNTGILVPSLVRHMSLSVMSLLKSPDKDTTLSANLQPASTEGTSVVVRAKHTSCESLSLKTRIGQSVWCACCWPHAQQFIVPKPEACMLLAVGHGMQWVVGGQWLCCAASCCCEASGPRCVLLRMFAI